MTNDIPVSPNEEPVARDYMLPNVVYDVLKPITVVILPGLTALYIALASIWGFPFGEEIAGSSAAVNVFLGLLVAASTRSYNHSDAKYDGAINMEETDDTKRFTLDLRSDPYELETKKEVTFKVNPS